MRKTKRSKRSKKKMGDCKDNMKTTSLDNKKSAGAFGIFKKKNKEVDAVVAKTFADLIMEADTKLATLIVKKESEVNTESGREDYNRKALAFLKTMAFHLDEVTNVAAEYSELN